VNIVKEDHDSESPAEYSEPVDGGEFNELPLKNDDKSFGTSCNFLIAPEAITLRLTFFPSSFSSSTLSGSEIQLKLRLSSTLSDVKLSVYSKDSIFACKKKLQVSRSGGGN
jgi:hypothetical protein